MRSDPCEFGGHSSTMISGFEMISNRSEWRMARRNEFSCSVAGSTCCGEVASVGSFSSAQHGDGRDKGNTAPLSASCSPMNGTGLSSVGYPLISPFHLNLRYRHVRYGTYYIYTPFIDAA